MALLAPWRERCHDLWGPVLRGRVGALTLDLSDPPAQMARGRGDEVRHRMSAEGAERHVQRNSTVLRWHAGCRNRRLRAALALDWALRGICAQRNDQEQRYYELEPDEAEANTSKDDIST